MVEVHVVVEGQTEETFVHRVLRPYFWPLGICFYPQLLGTGGICQYSRARLQIMTTLRQYGTAFCTTMFDYYGMPDSWPQREAAGDSPFPQRPAMIEQAILSDIAGELGEGFDRARLIPYVQMHEFEALLFSEPNLLAKGLELADDAPIQAIRDEFGTPEEIDDSPETAPSKRIMGLYPSYDKRLDGVFISQSIGLGPMRAQCPHFNEWIGKLETLAGRR